MKTSKDIKVGMAYKKHTIKYVKKMIEENDKGACGFWTDDWEGCGNPQIFPEFNDGLLYGKFVRLKHALCMYDTRILVPNKECTNYSDGCYHHCSIYKLKNYPDIRKKVLERFLDNFQNNVYYDVYYNRFGKHDLPSLLTDDELKIINKNKKTRSF